MAMKEQQRSTYRSMQGKEVDMHKLAMQNEMTIAIGNAKVNARGDELGPGGKIIRKREDVLREAQNAVPDSTFGRKKEEPVVVETPIAPVAAPITVKNSKKIVDDMDPEGNE